MWDNKEFLDTTKKLVADGRIEILAHGLTHEEDYFTMSKTDFSHLLMQFEQECEQHQLKFEKV